MKTKVLVVGAGIGGLAAGVFLKSRGENDFLIIEKSASLPLNLSNGVHYLHSNDLGLPFEFPLKKIECIEEIWYPRQDLFMKSASIPQAIEYAMKVMNTRLPSSIMDPGRRSWETYLPENNDMNELLRKMYEYIGEEHFLWNKDLFGIGSNEHKAIFNDKTSIEYLHLISTAPLDKFSEMLGINLELKSVPIHIVNYETKNIVPHWLISLYIPDKNFLPYRITVLNNIISMESVTEMGEIDEYKMNTRLSRFFDYEIKSGNKYKWHTGRIFGLSSDKRNSIIKTLDNDNIHLLGRFGKWSGKELMDSTIRDAEAIVKKIIE